MTMGLLFTAPLAMCGSFHGQQAANANQWAFLPVVYLVMSGSNSTVMGAATGAYLLITLGMHLVRLIDVVNPTDTTTINVWYYWVLYTVNELVPSTLLVMPVVWFQQMVIDEERSSSLANLKVQKLQRRQDDLLRALLPPAIIKHLRDGHDALLNSTHEAAVIFVYVTQVKTFSLTSDAPSVIKWLSSVYTAFDDVLQQEFRKSIIKIETQHDHFLAVSGIFDPREDASDVCIRAAA